MWCCWFIWCLKGLDAEMFLPLQAESATGWIWMNNWSYWMETYKRAGKQPTDLNYLLIFCCILAAKASVISLLILLAVTDDNCGQNLNVLNVLHRENHLVITDKILDVPLSSVFALPVASHSPSRVQLPTTGPVCCITQIFFYVS